MNRRRLAPLGVWLISTGLVVSAVVASVVTTACTASTTNAKDDKLCTAGAYVFCRCQNREEGTKLCNEDQQSFGACEPCETFDNPEIPLDPGEDPGKKPTKKDGGPVGGDEDAGDDPNPNDSCGDGVVQNGEDCDDKDSDETNGCNSKCKLAGVTPASSNACPGLEVHVWGGGHQPTLVSKTNGSGNRSVTPNCTTSSNPTSGAAASDRVFKVTAHKTGAMNVVTSDASYNVFLYVSEACSPNQNTWLACVNNVGGVGNESMQFPAESGKSYFVFVDGSGIDETKEGNFRVTFSID